MVGEEFGAQWLPYKPDIGCIASVRFSGWAWRFGSGLAAVVSVALAGVAGTFWGALNGRRPPYVRPLLGENRKAGCCRWLAQRGG